MKTLFVMLLALQVPAIASALPPDEPQAVLDKDAVGAIKAILAKPTEAAAFNAHSVLTKVTVIHQALSETMYRFEGKRLDSEGYRTLFILNRKGFVGDVGQDIYEAKLVP